MCSKYRIFISLLILGTAKFSSAQHNLYDHVFWDATGNHANQSYGYNGLDTLGRINDTIQQALSIGTDGIASFVYNRFRLDTTPHYKFPGRDVIRAKFNSDSFPDFLTIGDRARILLGTKNIDSFVVAATLNNDNQHYSGFEAIHTVRVFDFNSDGLSDIVFSNFYYKQDTLGAIGRLFFFKGGDVFDTIPYEVVTGRKHFTDYVGGPLMIGHFLRGSRLCLAEARMYGAEPRFGQFDTMRVFFYPIGKGFHLIPSDTLMFIADSTGTTLFADQFNVYAMDLQGDGRDEILVSGGDRVWAFHTDSPSVHLPFFTFHRKVATGSATFGRKVVNLGDITGKGYSSILITDPEGDAGSGYFGGTIFVYNIGKALKDSCVAMGTSNGAENYLGTQAIALTDVSGDSLSDWMIGRNDDDATHFNVGGVTVFLGDRSYGPDIVGVLTSQSPPSGFRLDQNFPNPFSGSTDITFVISDHNLIGSEVTLKLFDVMGNEILTAYRGTADGFGYTIRINAPALAPGMYFCRLSCDGRQLVRTLAHIH